MSDRVIRASEIAEYAYCRRAWWLSRVEGYESENIEELTQGTAFHEVHGARLALARIARRTAYLLLFLAVAIFVFLLVQGV